MDLIEQNLGNSHRHPWEYSRADSILKILKKYPKDGQYADVGAGDVYFAIRLADTLAKPIYVVDIGYEEVGPKGSLVLYNNIDQLQEQSLDVVLLMDVLEHIEDVDTFLAELITKIKPGGQLLVTVPAFQFLFSNHDVALKHFRRYSLSQLKNTLQKHGIEIDSTFYFYTTLLIGRMLIQLLEKLNIVSEAKGIGGWQYSANHVVTKFIKWMLNVDFGINYFLSKLGIKIPGLSICATCRKKS